MQFICAYCKKQSDKPTGHINRSKSIGAPIYCGRVCAGLGRRDNKTFEQKKSEKAQYDLDYRAKNLSLLKEKKRAYFQATYDPKKAAIERKVRMPKHVEYCRQPKYKEYKKRYDKKYLAKKHYGEFYEAAIILTDIEMIVDSREADSNNKLYLKSTTVKNEKMQKQKLTATNLKDALWDTLQQLQDGKIEAGQADSISSQAREILRTVKIQLDISRDSKRDVSADVIAFNG